MGGMTFEYQSVVLHDPEHPLHERCVDAVQESPDPTIAVGRSLVDDRPDGK
jgi:hypothetical protein